MKKQISGRLWILIISLAVLMQPSFVVTAFTGQSAENDEQAATVDLSDVSEDTAEMDELLILVKRGTRKSEISNIADNAGASLDNVGTLENGTKLAKVSFDDPDDMQAIADNLADEDKVMIVQPNYIYHLEDETSDDAGNDSYVIAAETSANDSYLSKQWYLNPQTDYAGAADVFAAWDALSDNTDTVTVAVIDTGAKLDHPDLGSIIREKCISFNNGERGSFTDFDDSDDDSGHGTHVCGILAAEAGNGKGIAGIACNKAKLIVIDAAKKKTFGFSTQDCVLAINYAREEGARIINLSLGGLFKDYVFDAAVDEAYDNGTLCVCAASNDSSSLPENPGDARGAVSVMSHKKDGSKVASSNFGIEKDVSAPGYEIYSTYTTSEYQYKNGTSMAAPVVSGIAALLLSEDSSLDARQLKNFIYTSSGSGTYASENGGMAFGRVNAANAMNNLKSRELPPEFIVLNRESISMYQGEEVNLEFAVYPAAAGRYASETSFSSDDSSVAAVDELGHITAVGPGDAVITVSCGDAETKCNVSVEDMNYIAVSELPFETTGSLSTSDPFVKFSDKYGSYCDGYELALSAGESIGINMTSTHAIPHIRVLDMNGTVLLEKTCDDDSLVMSHDLSFCAESAGTYRIQLMSYPNLDAAPDKEYILKVHDHDLDEIEAVPATCTTDGNEQYYKCSSCSAMFSDAAGKKNIEKVPKKNKLGHDYGGWTRLDDKVHQRVCSRDDSHIETASHIWDKGVVTTAPTCTDKGMKTYTCISCKATVTEAVDALGHDYGAWEKLDNEKHQRICSRDDSHIEQASHIWDKGVVTTAPTCTEKGMKKYTCTECGAAKSELMEATGHHYGKWKTVVASTETSAGRKVSECSACGNARTEMTAKLAPSLKKLTILKPKTAGRTITVQWKKASAIDRKKMQGIEIEIATDRDFKNTVKKGTAGKNKTSSKFKGLKPQTRYWVRIRAYKKAADGKHISKWKTTSIKTKK